MNDYGKAKRTGTLVLDERLVLCFRCIAQLRRKPDVFVDDPGAPAMDQLMRRCGRELLEFG